MLPVTVLPILVLPFTFREKTGQCLIRLLQRGGRHLLRGTVMDGELEKLLTGANTFEVRNGFVAAELSPQPGAQRELQLAIIDALDEHFSKASLREKLARY